MHRFENLRKAAFGQDQVELALLLLGNVRNDSHRVAAVCLSFANPQPAAVGRLLLDGRIAFLALGQTLGEPGFLSSSRGRILLSRKSAPQDVLKARSRLESASAPRMELPEPVVAEHHPVVTIEESEAFRQACDGFPKQFCQPKFLGFGVPAGRFQTPKPPQQGGASQGQDRAENRKTHRLAREFPGAGASGGPDFAPGRRAKAAIGEAGLKRRCCSKQGSGGPSWISLRGPGELSRADLRATVLPRCHPEPGRPYAARHLVRGGRNCFRGLESGQDAGENGQEWGSA